MASKGGEQQLWQPPSGDVDDHPVPGTWFRVQGLGV